MSNADSIASIEAEWELDTGLGAGIVLFFKHEVLPHDTFGLAFLLLLVAGFCIWVWGCAIRHPNWFRGP